jgi:hypothetical protein
VLFVFIFVAVKFTILFLFLQNVPVVTMAMTVNIIVGYALIVLVKDMKDFVQMDALTGLKASSVNHQVY